MGGGGGGGGHLGHRVCKPQAGKGLRETQDGQQGAGSGVGVRLLRLRLLRPHFRVHCRHILCAACTSVLTSLQELLHDCFLFGGVQSRQHRAGWTMRQGLDGKHVRAGTYTGKA